MFTDRFYTPFSYESLTHYGKVSGYQYEPIRYFVDGAGPTPAAFYDYDQGTKIYRQATDNLPRREKR